ncbi:MAG: 2-oxoglutarate ferredoxin oxidoreductase subunit alpha, partial [Nitrospinaceae bacterium]|nr:2-oxoglutarate ferredoxin oxidoreductase subunit alpha [Nitrospinaceae bacterium]
MGDTTNGHGANGGASKKETIDVESVTIRFAGDSGDGMQLTGDRFTTASAIAGNDIRTFPDYPAEIR